MNVPTQLSFARCRARTTRLARVVLVALVGVLAQAVVASPSAQAQELDDWESQAQALQEQVTQLEDRYLKPALLRSRFKVETRFNDAKVAYLLGDYEKSSILFVGLVDNPRAQKLDSYRESLYLLADGLYKQRNYLAARTYFHKVVDRGPGKFYQESIIKLLEIAAKTGNYAGVEDLYSNIQGSVDDNPAVNYVRAKTLFRQKRYDEARRFFQKAARGEDFALRADYFRGVAFAADGQLDNARQVFEQVIADYPPKSPAQQNLIDLTYLGLGRVAYEAEDYPQAVDYYQHLERTSPHFDEMLYELTWALIAQKKYEAASRVTDIFLYLSNPDPTFVPKVKLLKADLHLRLENYDMATQDYQDVVNTFSPVKQELERFVGDKRDLQGFFEKLVESELRGERPDYLPSLVQKWIEGSKVLDQAKMTVGDLNELRDSIQSSYAALEQMEARLEGGTRIQSFPKLAEGMTLAVELESRLVRLRQDMIEAQYKMVSSQMSPAEKQQWEELEKKVSKLREKYETMPKTQSQVRQRTEQINSRFSALRRQLDDVTFEIDAQQEQLNAIDNYMSNHEFSAEQMRKIDEKKKQARANLARLRDMQKDLREEVEIARQKVGVGDKVSTKEAQIRTEYRKMLARQREFLEQVGGRTGAGSGANLGKMQAARQMLPQVESRLQGFFKNMNQLVGERTDELRQDLASERKMLTLLDKEVARLIGKSKDVTAAVAYNGFLRVKRDFRDIIMRGDIGLIDVAWQKKEDMTQKINQLFEDRTAELKTLQESFEEVR